VQENQGVLFAGGYLDIKFAYHNTPRARNERRGGSNERGGPIRASFSQRQNRTLNQTYADPNVYQYTQMTQANITQPSVLNQVAQLATFLNQPSSVPTNLQQNQVQQLAYLLQLQQHLNQNQQRNNSLTPTSPSQIRM